MNKKKHYLVYKITNLINGKIYIGQHETYDPNDDYMGSGNLIKRAIKKYGVENFKKEILFDFETEEEMNAKEKELVNESFVEREDTYNLVLGGRGSWKHCCGEKHNNLHNCRRTGFLQALDAGINLNAKRLAEMTEKEKKEYFAKISEGVKRHYKEFGSHWQGKKHSQETINKMCEIHAMNKHQQGEKNSNFGKHWYMNPATGESKSFGDKDNIPEGWIRGRKVIS